MVWGVLGHTQAQVTRKHKHHNPTCALRSKSSASSALKGRLSAASSCA